MLVIIGFNPSWESRPSGTFEISVLPETYRNCFNPSWESRPSGTGLYWNGDQADQASFNPSWESRPSGTRRIGFVTHGWCWLVSTPHGRAVPLELVRRNWKGLLAIVSTPHGRAVPLEPFFIAGIPSRRLSFNPSWESRPSGTKSATGGYIAVSTVSTPHGRAVPLERRGNATEL